MKTEPLHPQAKLLARSPPARNLTAVTQLLPPLSTLDRTVLSPERLPERLLPPLHHHPP